MTKLSYRKYPFSEKMAFYGYFLYNKNKRFLYNFF